MFCSHAAMYTLMFIPCDSSVCQLRSMLWWWTTTGGTNIPAAVPLVHSSKDALHARTQARRNAGKQAVQQAATSMPAAPTTARSGGPAVHNGRIDGGCANSVLRALSGSLCKLGVQAPLDVVVVDNHRWHTYSCFPRPRPRRGRTTAERPHDQTTKTTAQPNDQTTKRPPCKLRSLCRSPVVPCSETFANNAHKPTNHRWHK